MLFSLEQAARGIGLHGNSDETDIVCFNQDSAISSLIGKPLKLVDQFMYLSSNISSTESSVNMCLDKAWTAICELTPIWKSDLFDEINQEFFQAEQFGL